MRKIVLCSLPFLFFSLPALSQDDDADASTPGPARCPGLQASTIFVPDKSFSRQEGSAERISETHDKAEAQGWDFNDMEIYIEDGDLQGFFITYTRPHPCNQSNG